PCNLLGVVIRGLSDFRLDVNTRYEGGWDAYNVLQGAYSIRMSRLETQTTVLGAEQPNDPPAVEYHYDLIQAPFPLNSLMGTVGGDLIETPLTDAQKNGLKGKLKTFTENEPCKKFITAILENLKATGKAGYDT